MPLFGLLIVFFLIVLIAVGLAAGLGLGTVAAIMLYRFRRGKRVGMNGGFLGGLGFLFSAIVVLGPTCWLAAWLLPGLVSDYQKFAAEREEEPTLRPALDDVHRFVNAQAAYHAANGNLFDTPECLARPRTCIPGYAGPPFLDAKIASLGTRGGFTWSFHPGPAPPGLSKMEKASRSSISTYALRGVPTGGAKRARSVCGDFNGVCTFFGSKLDDNGGCPADCVHHIWSEDYTLPPLVIGFAPARAFVGTTITITASKPWSFGDEVRFGGVTAPNFTFSGHKNEARVDLPKGAVSGKITITTANGMAQSAEDFVVLVYTGLSATPARMQLVAGQTQQLAATAAISDGTTADVSARVSWISAEPAVATVDEGGLVVSKAPGIAKVTARSEGFTAVAIIKVVPPMGVAHPR